MHRNREKAWHRLVYKDNTYIPVVILERITLNRTLVAHEDPNGRLSDSYQVDDDTLLPRSSIS